MQKVSRDIVCDTINAQKRMISQTVPGINSETLNVNITATADPLILLTVINNVSFTPITVILPNPPYATLKYFYINPAFIGFPVIIKTAVGSFQLINSVQLCFCTTSQTWTNSSSPLAFFPAVQVGNKLVGTMAIPTSQQGHAVSLSGDGSTLAIGAPADNGNVGATWIFIRNVTTGLFSQLQKLVSNDINGVNQGSSVSLSADGSTLAVGAINTNILGATYIWARDPITNMYFQQGPALVDPASLGGSQGNSVSLSSDGNTLAVGNVQDIGGNGSTSVYIRDPITKVWSQQGLALVGTGGSGGEYQGWSVSLSADGNTLAEGAPFDTGVVGATWIFNRAGGVWTQTGLKLAGTGFVIFSAQGTSVSLNSSGSVLAVGGPFDSPPGNFFNGATWIFVKDSVTGVWTQFGSKLVAPTTPSSQQGTSVSISASGATVAVGAPLDGDYGATWIFVRNSTTGVYENQGRLEGTGNIDLSTGQGTSVSLDANGDIVAIGGPFDNGNVGATWIFS